MNESIEVTYYIKTLEGLFLTNIPKEPSDATYHASRPREYNGLENVNVDWEKHLVVVIETITHKKYKTVSPSELEVIESA